MGTRSPQMSQHYALCSPKHGNVRSVGSPSLIYLTARVQTEELRSVNLNSPRGCKYILISNSRVFGSDDARDERFRVRVIYCLHRHLAFTTVVISGAPDATPMH